MAVIIMAHELSVHGNPPNAAEVLSMCSCPTTTILAVKRRRTQASIYSLSFIFIGLPV